MKLKNNKIKKIKKENIDLDKILVETINENKIMYLSAFILIISLTIEIVVFPSMYSNFVANFPDKIIDINYSDILWLLLPYISAELLFSLADTIDSYTLPKIEDDVIIKLITKTFNSSKNTKKEINNNDLILNLRKISDIKDIYYLVCAYTLPAIAVSCGLGYYFIKADKAHGIVMCVILAISFYVLFIMGKSCSSNTNDNEENNIEFYDDMNDIISNISNVLSSGTDKDEINRIKNNQKKYYKSNVGKNLCNTNLKFSFSLIYFFIMLIFNGVAIKLYHENKINKSVLVTIFFMVSALISIYDSMAYEVGNLTNSLGVYKTIKKYFKNYINKTNDTNNTKLQFPFIEGKIDFKNIIVKYNDKKIFDNFNLTIHPNYVTGIIGKIGSGKSTLLKVLAGLIDYEGIITIDDTNILEYENTEISKFLGYIPQNPKLFNRTIFENLNYGSNYDEKYIWDKIKLFDLYDLFNSFENKLQTIVGKNGEKISGGQRQIIYILRTIIQNKKILLFDEPTSALDISYKTKFINLLSKIKNQTNSTIIIVTHDNDVMAVCDKILLFSQINTNNTSNTNDTNN